MPTRRVTEQTEITPVLTPANVIDIWRMADLAWNWASEPLQMEKGAFDQLKKYTNIYGIDTAELLFTLQGILRERQYVEYSQMEQDGNNPEDPPSAPES